MKPKGTEKGHSSPRQIVWKLLRVNNYQGIANNPQIPPIPIPTNQSPIKKTTIIGINKMTKNPNKYLFQRGRPDN